MYQRTTCTSTTANVNSIAWLWHNLITNEYRKFAATSWVSSMPTLIDVSRTERCARASEPANEMQSGLHFSSFFSLFFSNSHARTHAAHDWTIIWFGFASIANAAIACKPTQIGRRVSSVPSMLAVERLPHARMWWHENAEILRISVRPTFRCQFYQEASARNVNYAFNRFTSKRAHAIDNDKKKDVDCIARSDPYGRPHNNFAIS